MTLPPAAAVKLKDNVPLAVFGLALIVIAIAAPGGIQGLLRRIGLIPQPARPRPAITPAPTQPSPRMQPPSSTEPGAPGSTSDTATSSEAASAP